ncbi:L domain-like protein, partial [Rozella allomycis CSF55]
MISASLTFSVSSKSERSIKNKFFVTRQHFEAVTKLLEDFDKTINVKNEGLKTLDLLQQSIKMSIHNFPTFLCRESFITRLQKQVTKINIDDNFLSEISDDISIYENLLILNASRNCIRRVSSKIGNCKKLNRLILDTNEIEELPFEIGLLQELTYVHLERNRITNFPLNLTQCVHLKMLDLSINELEELPKEIGNL